MVPAASNWEWLERRVGRTLPRTSNPKPSPPLRVGGLTIQAAPGSQAIVAEYDRARGLYVVLEVPDYLDDDVVQAPRGASPNVIADAIVGVGGAAAEVVTGVGGWIASYFPKAGEAQGENQRRKMEALAQGQAEALRIAEDVENYAEIADARAQGRAAVILARAQRKVMEMLGMSSAELDEIEAPPVVAKRRPPSTAPTVTLVRDLPPQEGLVQLIQHSREIRAEGDVELPQGRRRTPRVSMVRRGGHNTRSCCDACAAGADTCPCEG